MALKLHRGTAAQWAAANPVLAQSEPAYETDTGTVKIGDGTTAYNSLLSFVTYTEEFAYNYSTTTTTDTTSFGYGPEGAFFQAFTAQITKTIRFKTPVQNTDKIFIEIMDPTTGIWQNVNEMIAGSLGFVVMGGTNYGIWLGPIPTALTDMGVSFGSTAKPTNATYAGAGEVWADYVTYKWRVRKISHGVA